MPLEPIEFASEGVNASIFLSRDTFTNLLEIVPDTFGRRNILDLMIFLWNQMICDENPDFSIEFHLLCLVRSDSIFVFDSYTILDNFPSGRVDGHDVPLHFVLPIRIVLPIVNRNRFPRANSCKQHS